MIDFYEHIEEYINGELSPEDKEAFDQALLSDPKLQRAVDNHDIVSDALDILIEDDIRSVINDIDLKEEEDPKIVPLPKRQNRLMYYAAASVLFLFTAYMSMNIFIKAQYSHQAVLDEYYIPPANPNATRSETFEGPPLEEAMYLFDLRRFEESETKFEGLLEKTSSTEELDIIHFYLGNITYIKDDINSAKSHLTKTNDSRKHYYLGQIYYLEGDVPSLKAINESHPSEELNELIQQTKSWKYNWAK